MAKASGESFSSIQWWIESCTWKRRRVTGLTGLKGSSKAYLLSHWRERVGGPLLVIVPDLQTAETLAEDLRFFQRERGGTFLIFPPWETLPYDEIPPHPEIARGRVTCLFAVGTNDTAVIISPVKAVMQKVMAPGRLQESTLCLTVGEEVNRERLVYFLDRGGYNGVRIVEERGDFSLRGAIVDIFSPLYEEPLRFEFVGDRLESIRRFDIETQRSSPDGLMAKVMLLPATDVIRDPSDSSPTALFDYFSRGNAVFIVAGETVEQEAQAYSSVILEHYERALKKKGYVPPPEAAFLSFEDLLRCLAGFTTIYLEEGPLAPPQCRHVVPFFMEGNEDLLREVKASLSAEATHPDVTPFAILSRNLQEWERKGMTTFVVSHTSSQAERLGDLLSHYRVTYSLESPKGFREILEGPRQGVTLFVGGVSAGFRNPQEGWVLLTEEEIFGERRRLRPGRGRKSPTLSTYSELRENDFVVHLDFGVGRYRGLRHLKIGVTSNDYLLLEYVDGDKLYVPVDRLNLIQRYVGGDGKGPKLDKLGSQSWERTKRRVRAALTEMVKELLDLYAARKAFRGHSFSPVDQWYRAFEATFEYEETPDQLKAIDEVSRDMSNSTPMDRLICGDVGYGKTEVAVRATYRAVMDGKQVAVLVPTTVLAQQHHQTFLERFRNYPVLIEVLSRFRTPGEQKKILQELREGKVDVILGTHRLLQKDVVFRNLGLVVVDEEHRFGVTHKERLKQLKRLVDVVTLTATPIPRTLQMGISGMRDLTLIQTPPQDRLSIQTFVVRYDDELIREAIERELGRGGQVFFVHPRVQNIHAMADHLRRLVPRASLAVAHGQMRDRDLEKVMLQFVRREVNVLVCTSIIESGLDIPSANTILIHHAERFGLADLYQLRGRVGRGRHQAHAYLLVPTELALSKDAVRRLRAIQELSELGSGFKLALQDLEIRGAGNLLGPTQSGHVHAVGFELYTQLMERAVKELRGEDVTEEITPEIRVHLPAFIPESYVEDPAERLNLYRRLSLSRTDADVDMIREELIDRFGNISPEVVNLLEVIKLKILLTRLSVSKFEMTSKQLVLTFHERTSVSPQRVIEWVKCAQGRYRITPESRLVVEEGEEALKDPWGTARKLLHALM